MYDILLLLYYCWCWLFVVGNDSATHIKHSKYWIRVFVLTSFKSKFYNGGSEETKQTVAWWVCLMCTVCIFCTCGNMGVVVSVVNQLPMSIRTVRKVYGRCHVLKFCSHNVDCISATSSLSESTGSWGFSGFEHFFWKIYSNFGSSSSSSSRQQINKDLVIFIHFNAEM